MSTNISKEKRERLVQKINAIKTYLSSAAQDENTAQLLTYISDIEKDIKGKKYGLVFEEHREGIDEVLANNLPVLTEDTDLLIDNGGQINFLIEGDNLASLKLLEKTHKGRIDLIYIDPPYNTGHNDFVYDDNFISTNDSFIHSKWLSFIKSRLFIAKQLLSEKGIIFISINDIEQAQLKLLCDEIFGIENFITTMPKKGSGGRQDSKVFAVVHEYVVCYVKSISKYIAGRELKGIGNYPLFDEIKQRHYKLQLLRKWGDNSRRENRPNLYYPIYYTPNDSTFSIERESNDSIEIYPMLTATEAGCWRWGKSTMQANMSLGLVECKIKENEYIPYERTYEPIETQTKPYSTWLDNIDNNSGSVLLKQILGNSSFDYPKPLDLIEKLLKMGSPVKDYLVLDFFAGSGTTGHAVMKLNAEDGGSRKFILCTNNENNICRDVTYERIKRVIAKEDYKASLKYFKVDYLPISDKLYYEYADDLLLHIRELVELENGINFNGNAEIAIVLTEKELDDFTQNIPETCKTIYVGHDVLPTEEQEKIFAKRKIKVNVIPEYYYRDLEG